MSQASMHTHADDVLADTNNRIEQGVGATLSTVLIVAGLAGIVTSLIAGGVGMVPVKHAKIAILVGIVATLGISIGALFTTMMFHAMSAGWTATIRRQFENLMLVMWAPGLLMVLFIGSEFLFPGKASSWLDPEVTNHGTEHLFVHKQPYLSIWFTSLRALLYACVFTFLVRRLWHYSTEQDRTGDRWLTNKARTLSCWGLVACALVTTFFAFDWLMLLTDYHFFSTMWGVYFFAGSVYAVFAAAILVFAALKGMGKLAGGVVTEEHLHDMSKIFFAFTVFWAYIAFGQYFLIWYANIPEETAWFVFRKENYSAFTILLACGHFVMPFFVLLWYRVRRTWTLILTMAVWGLLMHVLDMYWILRPAVYTGSLVEGTETIMGYVVDVVAIGGVFAVFAGVLIKQIARGPLAPLHDPRLPEAMHHRNYI